MDKKDALKIAEKYIQAVGKVFPIEKALLFGSYAKGNFGNGSDIDIAVVWDFKDDFFYIQLELMKLRRDIDLSIEPHPFSSDSFSAQDPIVSEI